MCFLCLRGGRAGAPSGSLRLATSPKTAGGGWGCRRARGSTTDMELAPDRPPFPRPLSPAAREKGENSILLRTVGSASAGAPSGSLRLATSPKTAGGGWGCRRAHGSTTGIELAPDRPPLPRPLSPAAREKGENSIPLRQALSAVSPAHHVAGTRPCLPVASPRRRPSCGCCSEFIRHCRRRLAIRLIHHNARADRKSAARLAWPRSMRLNPRPARRSARRPARFRRRRGCASGSCRGPRPGC